MVREIHRLQGRTLLVVAALCMALPGCGSEGPSVGGQNKPEQPMETLSTGQIVSVIKTINEGESKQAQLVIDRLQNADVKAYAEKLLLEHRNAQTELTTLATTLQAKEQSSATQMEVDKLGQKMNAALEKESAERIDMVFLDVQLFMHQKALDNVERLLDQAQEAELKEYLDTFQTSLQDHLREAGRLRTKLYPEPKSML